MSWYFLPYIATVELGEGGHSSAQTELLQKAQTARHAVSSDVQPARKVYETDQTGSVCVCVT